MARYNKIFAGPVTEVLPQVEEALTAAAITPGKMITLNGSGLWALAVAATTTAVRIAQEDYLTGKGVDDNIASGDLCIGLEMLPTQFYNARVAATVVLTKGAALSLGASGNLVLATATSRVVAFSEEALTVGASADLVRVRPAIGYRLET